MPDHAPAPASTELSGPFAGMVHAALTRAVRAQTDAAGDYVAWLRERHPTESPAEIRRRLDARFLTAVTASGVGVGATAALPGLGTVLALGAVGAESLVFLEATAFYALAVARVHGLEVDRADQEESLVDTVVAGAAGTALLSHLVEASDAPGVRTPPTGRLLPVPGVAELSRRLTSRFVRRHAVRRASLAAGKLAPAGLGAALGGWGNRRLGRVVVDTVHDGLGDPPGSWPRTDGPPGGSDPAPPVR